jgi:hypothetical protein
MAVLELHSRLPAFLWKGIIVGKSLRRIKVMVGVVQGSEK